MFKYKKASSLLNYDINTNNIRFTNESFHFDSNNNNKRNNRWSTYRSFFIKPYTSEKKERRKNHHNAIIEILKKWTDIKLELVEQKDSLYITSIPLYVDVINRIESLDEYNEARSHLENKKYSRLLSHYNNIKKLQNNYNKKVSEFMQTTETRIKNETFLL